MLRQLVWKFALPILATLSPTAYASAPYVDRLQTTWFRTGVELRPKALFNSTEYALFSLVRDPNTSNLSQYLERLTTDEQLRAIIVCDSTAKRISQSASAPASIDCKPAATLACNHPMVLDGKSFHAARFVAAAGSAAPLYVVLERFDAIEYLLERAPGQIGKPAFIQIAAPTRSRFAAYVRLQEETREAANRINDRFRQDDWSPIILLDRHHEPKEVLEYMRACDFCLVNSLQDGMNRVAKPFVAAREDARGVLILSTFAGASRELVEDLIVNPYDIAGTAEALRQAWKMSAEEQRARIRPMHRTVKENNVYRRAGHMLNDVARVRQQQRISAMRDAVEPRDTNFMDYL